MMVHSTEAALDLQLAPTPAAAAMWPHWGWGVVLAVSLVVLGILGVVVASGDRQVYHSTWPPV